MLLHLLLGQRLRPVAAVHQHDEITNFCSPAMTQVAGTLSMGAREVLGLQSATISTPVPRHDEGP